jgi:hypothetical protein
MTHILSLDPGLRTGWAKSDGTCGTLDLHEALTTDRGAGLGMFAFKVSKMLCGASLLLIERPMGRIVATLLPEILTARAHEVACDMRIARMELTVPSIRKIVCGDARADKKAVQAAVAAAGWRCKTPHEADAVAVLLAGIEKAKTERLAA